LFTSGCAFVCITCKGRVGSLSVTEINPQTPSKHKVWVRGRSWGVERWFRVCFERPIDVRRKRALIVFVCGYILCYLSMHHTRLSLGLLRSDFLLWRDICLRYSGGGYKPFPDSMYLQNLCSSFRHFVFMIQYVD
jgi:hypothetical protein